MKAIYTAIASLCIVSAVCAWNPLKVGSTFPMNRLMIDGDGELTSLDDLLAEGRPLFAASSSTD